MSNSAPSPASLWRRLAAMVYDGLLLFAVIIVIGVSMLPFTHGLGMNPQHPVFKMYFLGAIFVFFGWFWTHGGQTLGMRAWRIRIQQVNGQALSWPLALLRYVLSLPMWGFMLYVITSTSELIHPLPILANLPEELLYPLACTWLIIDHLPGNWRDRLGRVQVIHCRD